MLSGAKPSLVGMDCFTNLYILVRKRKIKRENIQCVEIRKSNSETMHTFKDKFRRHREKDGEGARKS